MQKNKINLIEEKVSAKLLYLFDSDFYYKKKLYMESESENKSSFLKSIKNIFKFIGSVLTKFSFIGFLIFLIITSVITSDIFSFILSIIIGIILGTGISKLITNGTKALGIEGTKKKINELLKENGYKEVDFDKVRGICYKKTEVINLNDALKEALDKDEKNNFNNKKLKKIIKNLTNRIEIEKVLLKLLNTEDSDSVSYLESHGFKKISSEDFIIIDNKNNKSLLTNFLNNLENKYAYEQYNPEKIEIINRIKSNLEINKNFDNILTKRNAFGLKPFMNYLNDKAKKIQKYVSDIIMLIISIFNKKAYSESSIKTKKEIKKMKFFLENYLQNKNKKNNFHKKEKENYVYNENFALPFSKNGNPGNAIKIVYKINNHKIIINSIINEIKIIGSNYNQIFKQIFPNKNITEDSYKWQKGEWSIIKKYIESYSLNKNIDNDKNLNINDKENDLENEDKKNDLENEDKKNNNNEENQDKDKENDLENKDEKNNNDLEINSSSIKKKTSYLLLMKKGIESTPIKYLIIAIIIAIPILSLGATSLASAKASFSSSFLGKIITEISNFLGWGTIITSSAVGLGYYGIEKYIKNMNIKMLSTGMENAEKNSNKLKDTIMPAINKMENIAEKDENIIDKKQISDNFNYQNKKELLYNENYIISEYFKIEKKLKKQVF